MSWVVLANGGGGVGLSDPIQHAQKKNRPKPLCWTRVAMVTPLPSGTRSAGNQLTECVCSVYVGIPKMSRHRDRIKQSGLTIASSRWGFFSPFGPHWKLLNLILPCWVRSPPRERTFRLWKRVSKGCRSLRSHRFTSSGPELKETNSCICPTHQRESSGAPAVCE